MTNRLTLLLDLLANAPADAFTLFAIAKEYEGAGDDAQALDFYQKLRAADPNYVGLYYHLGKLHERLGSPEAALEAYRTGMDVAKKARDFHALNELAGAKMNLGDFDEEDDF
ncbi:MAG: tetratricopeptide repeat protein [Saprospiraceae bacterium]